MSLRSWVAARSRGGLTRGCCDLILMGLVLAVGCLLKWHYSNANADELSYVLAPTAALVEWVTGTPWVAEVGAGYLSRELSILIAPSCAGVNFLVIAWCMLGAGFLRQLGTTRSKLAWLVLSAALAYTTTVVANAARIVAGAALRGARVADGAVSAGQLHRLEGAVVYLTALVLLFGLATRLVSRWAA